MEVAAMEELTPFLKGVLKRAGKNLVHVTGLDGYKGICDAAAIEPNRGLFPFTYPQSKSAYSTVKPAVALFDFSIPWRKVSKAEHWPQFFFCHRRVTLALVIDRKSLPLPLTAYDQAVSEVGILPTKIPIVECWHAGPIPFGCIDRVLVIRKHPERVRTVSPRAKVLSSSNLRKALWPHLPPPLTEDEENTEAWLKMFENWEPSAIEDMLERARLYDESRRLERESGVEPID
jgi:hypothetical protein